jgi:glutamate racemase
MKRPQDLVVMDWGIGGISVYNEIRKLLPELSILYFSDSGQTPYGKMSAQALSHRVSEVIAGFAAQGIRHFVVGCNAASTVLPGLAPSFAAKGLQVTGVIQHGITLIQKSRFQNVAVIGGRRTVLSRQYTQPFSGGKRRVVGRIAQPLSALIEKGELNSPRMHRALHQIIQPLGNCDALVLACTHYPAIGPLIQQMMPGCEILDPAFATAKFVKTKWHFKAKGPRKNLFMTSGNGPEMSKAAKLAFGTHISKVISV